MKEKLFCTDALPLFILKKRKRKFSSSLRAFMCSNIVLSYNIRFNS